MASYQRLTSSVSSTFKWPACPPPHPSNLAVASKLCTTFLHPYSTPKPTTTYIPSGWSSNDVILVSLPPHLFVVKLPRRCQISSQLDTTACHAEAVRTLWAASYGFGPKVLATDEHSGGFAMEYIEGSALGVEMIKRRFLPEVIAMLRRIHDAPAESWMRRYNPMAVVRRQLEGVKERSSMAPEDVYLIEGIIRGTEEAVRDHPWSPCHNDFHSQNVMLVGDGSLRVIDFEDCDLGDPMWDLAYLVVSLELEENPVSLGNMYGVSGEEARRMKAYLPLAMAHCATWAALHGGVWMKHQEEVMGRLRR